MNDALLVYVTAPDHACALKIARAAVESRLAACANIMPNVTSIYRWQGAVEEAGGGDLVSQNNGRCL